MNTLTTRPLKPFARTCNELKTIQDKIKYIKKTETELKTKLIEMCKGETRSEQGWTFAVSLRLGSVDYAKIPQLFGIALDQYRKEPIAMWRLKFEREFKNLL